MISTSQQPAQSALPTLIDVIKDREVRRRLFRNLPLFQDVDDETCHSVSDSSEHIHRRHNHDLIVQGDSARNTYIVLSGLVHIKRTSETNDNYHLCYQGPTQPLGLVNLVCDERHKYSMRLVKDSDLMLIDRDRFMDAFNASAPLRRNVMRHMNRRFYETSDRLQQHYRLIDKESRFLVELLDILQALDTQIVSDDNRQDEILIDWLSNDRAAERLGCDPRTIGHAKQRLKGAGLISTIPLCGTICIKRSNMDTLLSIHEKLDTFNLQSAIKLGVKKIGFSNYDLLREVSD